MLLDDDVPVVHAEDRGVVLLPPAIPPLDLVRRAPWLALRVPLKAFGSRQWFVAELMLA